MTIYISAGIAVLGVGSSAAGGRQNANEIARGGRGAAVTQERAFESQLALNRPRLEVGNSALAVLSELFGLDAPSKLDFGAISRGGELDAEGVRDSYRDILGRNPDQGGLDFYLSRGSRDATGERGAFTPDDIARAHRSSAEYQQLRAAGQLPPKEAEFLGDPSASANYRGEFGQIGETIDNETGRPIDLESLVSDNPLIQFQKEQDFKAGTRAAAAAGLGQSGGFIDALGEQAGRRTATGIKDFVLNPLFELAGFGERASANTQSAIDSNSGRLANIALNSADARGSAFQNTGNVIGNLLSDFAGARLVNGRNRQKPQDGTIQEFPGSPFFPG